MTLLPFGAALAVIAVAAYRVLSKFRLRRPVAWTLGVLVAAALVVPPALLFSTEPPAAGPAGGSGPAELVVEPTTGWQANEAAPHELILPAPGRATVVIGPAGSGRPEATIAVRARASGATTTLSVEFGGEVLASERLRDGVTRFRFVLPTGTGPASLLFSASAPPGRATGVVVVESLHAFITGSLGQ